MKKDNLRIKENYGVKEKISCLKEYVSYFFIGGNYTPYYAELALPAALIDNYFDGIEFDEEEGLFEIQDLLETDEELGNLYNQFIQIPDVKMLVDMIKEQAKDIVEFEKQKLIHSPTSIDKKVTEILDKESKRLDAETKALDSAERLNKAQSIQIENQNAVNEHFTVDEQAEMTRKMYEMNFDPEETAKYMAENFLNSDKHGDDIKEILDAKNEKISELKQYKAAHDARNVLSEG